MKELEELFLQVDRLTATGISACYINLLYSVILGRTLESNLVPDISANETGKSEQRYTGAAIACQELLS